MTSKIKSTKQLAWELGLLRKRSVSVSLTDGSRKSKPDVQLFSHLIVIDYESTCWENEKTIPQEIIEFPAVLINCQSGEIEDEFHYFTQPSENPHLSDFCQQLTGISQDQVDNGIPISLCLRKFLIWLKRLQREKGIVCADDKNLSLTKNEQSLNGAKLAAFVTWSDWDLGVCLFYEAKRKQIMKPSVLDRWIDLRATYRNFYSRRPDGLSGALKDLGINFDGRQHSGLDDAKNTAKLAYRMICDGCVLNITKTLKTGPNGERIRFPFAAATSCSSTTTNPSPRQTVESKGHQTLTAASSCVKNSSDSLPRTSPPTIAGKLKLSERNKNVPVSSRALKRSHTPYRSDEASDTGKGCSNALAITDVTTSTLKVPSLATQRRVTPRKTPIKVSKRTTDQNLHNTSIKNPHLTPTRCSKITPNKNSKRSPLQNSRETPTGRFKKTPIKRCAKTPLKNVTKTPVGNSKKVHISDLSSHHQITLFNYSINTSISSRHSYHYGNQSGTSKATLRMPFKTPSPGELKPLMRVTPPLCSCGRRSKRRCVQNPGPNIGRSFYSCPVNSLSSGGSKGCRFFKWETPPSNNRMLR